VVNEAFARRFWGDASAIGRPMRVDGHEVTVVGVAANGKYEYLAALDDPSPPFVYLPFAQWANFTVVMHVRATGDPMALVPSVRRAVESVDSRLTATSPSTLDSYSSVPTLPIRLASRVLTCQDRGLSRDPWARRDRLRGGAAARRNRSAGAGRRAARDASSDMQR
jgi:hypothetical protein